MKVECYRKRLSSKIKYFLKSFFGRGTHTKYEDYVGVTLPPLAGLRLDIASKIMEIGDWRSKYDRY